MAKYAKCFVALCFSLAVLLVCAAPSNAQQNPVTAIDIALEPDATMIQHAQADNARLLKAFPKGFALDATHHPHISMLQQFVRTADLDKVYAAANEVFANEKPTSWKLKAFKYYYIPSPPIGLAGIVVEPTADLHRLQQELIDAVTPFTVKTGTPAAFISTEDGRDIQPSNRIRRQLCEDRGRREIQSARHDWRWHGNLLERDARRAVRSVHVLASVGVCLSTRQFWYGPKGTQGVGLDALEGGLGKRRGPRRLTKASDASVERQSTMSPKPYFSGVNRRVLLSAFAALPACPFQQARRQRRQATAALLE